jgi:energy-coupling factor transport system permease protein
MHNFEFLRMVNIGQYLPLPSTLHRLDPRARILIYTSLILAATFTHHALGLAVAFVVILVGLLLGRIPMRFALRGLLPPLPFLAILAVLQIFLAPHPADQAALYALGSIKIFPAGLVSAGMLLLRFMVLILGLSLASFTLSTSELIHGLESLFSPLIKIGIPTHDLVMVMQVTIRFIPFLAQSAERIAKAQASRGAEWGTGKGGLLARTRQLIPLVLPLFLTSLRRAETMALAMDARGYDTVSRRTSMIVMHFTWKDGLAILLGVLAGAGVILVG